MPDTLTTGNVGSLNTWFVTTTGCRTSSKPVQFSVVAGRLPGGLTLFTRGVSSGGITGRPTTAGTFPFTLQVCDQTGATDTESFSITINPTLPVVITNQGDALTAGVVGEFYCCGNLFADGGTHVDAALRRAAARLSLQASPGRITGTPTTPGTYTFLMRATDTRGALAERTFTITVT